MLSDIMYVCDRQVIVDVLIGSHYRVDKTLLSTIKCHTVVELVTRQSLIA